MNISIIGLGKLGSPMAALFAGKGHTIIGADVNPVAVDLLNKGTAPVHEPELQDWITRNKARLSATTDGFEAVRKTDATFVVVPTPSEPDGTFSLRYVIAAAQSIGAALLSKSGYHLVVLCSTVMPGSSEGVVLPILESFSGKRCGLDFGLCYNPEFIALGSVIRDMKNPDMLLIGESDPRAGEMLATIHKGIVDNNPRIARMNFINAELVKLSVNTFVTTKISYANMLAEVCEVLPGADVDVVTNAVGSDSRIGTKYLKGGLGYGGPCFPRDNVALAALFRGKGLEPTLGEATDRTNRRQVRRLLNTIFPHVPPNGTVAVLGLSYKPNTDVIENSQGIELAAALAAKGIDVVVYDPAALDNARRVLPSNVAFAQDMQDCLRNADVVVIATPWAEFQRISIQDLKQARGDSKTTIFDCWRVLSNEVALVTNYRQVGLGPQPDYPQAVESAVYSTIGKGA